jgi:hypothetical protein
MRWGHPGKWVALGELFPEIRCPGGVATSPYVNHAEVLSLSCNAGHAIAVCQCVGIR